MQPVDHHAVTWLHNPARATPGP